MIPGPLSPSSSKPKPTVQPEASDSKPVASRTVTRSSKGESQASSSSLKRTHSLPARLPSHTPQRAEVKLDRKPIIRPKPDTEPPKTFEAPRPRKIFGIPLAFNRKNENGISEEEIIRKGARQKMRMLSDPALNDRYEDLSRKGEFRGILKDFRKRSSGKEKWLQEEKEIELLYNHPKFAAEMAEARNKLQRIPNGPTGSRMMRPDEQDFLMNAFDRIQADVHKHPFHIHGESAMVGNANNQITDFSYNAGKGNDLMAQPGTQYHLHTHPPFGGPFTSAASDADHVIAAENYFRYGADTYFTDGKDVMHIMPNSTEVIKLTPDPELEKRWGKFPVAFKVPDPKRPPYPLSHHESPFAFKKWDSPEDWNPPLQKGKAKTIKSRKGKTEGPAQAG